jgi:HTH-type transcriptional regulator/antitoxin HigA
VTTYTPAEVFPAGEYLRDELEERGWTVTEFADILGRPLQAVSEILNGKKEITVDTAISIGEALGTSPELWLNLQNKFRLFEQRSNPSIGERARDVGRRARLREVAPIAKMRGRGWLPDTDDLDQLEDALLALFGIGDLRSTPSFAMAARRANSSEPITPEQIAWLARIRKVGGEVSVKPFDVAALGALATSIPSRVKSGPAELVGLPQAFAQVGVCLVFCEGLAGGKLDGAVTFLANGTPVIGLTTRGDRFDSVVFTLLHECAHLTLGHISGETPVIVDDDLVEEQTDPVEVEANEQASAWIFPGGLPAMAMTIPAIVDVAGRFEVHPSLVLGRLQRDTGDWKRHRAKIPKVRPHLSEAGVLS